jgi:hypothetical protein
MRGSRTEALVESALCPVPVARDPAPALRRRGVWWQLCSLSLGLARQGLLGGFGDVASELAHVGLGDVLVLTVGAKNDPEPARRAGIGGGRPAREQARRSCPEQHRPPRFSQNGARQASPAPEDARDGTKVRPASARLGPPRPASAAWAVSLLAWQHRACCFDRAAHSSSTPLE